MSELATDTPVSSDRNSELEQRLETHRRELAGYCYRMLGSTFETDDAVQDTMLRAWRALDRFDGRSSLRTWLYRIATNVCLDMLNGRNRRALPMDLGPSSPPVQASLGQPHPEAVWIQPIAGRRRARRRRRPGGRGGRPGDRSGWPSSPRCSICRRGNARC